MTDRGGQAGPTTSAPAPEALDPFGYFAEVASKIRNLGGPQPRPEINYGFHTFYVRCAPGYCTFSVKVDGLSASTGMLNLQVNMLSIVPGSHARIAVIERVPLATLAARGGVASVTFESLRGQIYALYGQINDDTDASADALSVTLDRPGSDDDDVAPDMAHSSYRATAVGTSERLSSDAPATLLSPVSQPCTARQRREPTYLDTAAVLGETATDDRLQWERIYAYRVLHRYGMIARDASGLWIGEEAGALPGILSTHGCALRECPDYAAMPGEGGPFDFICAAGSMDSFADAHTALRLAEAMIGRVRPGGLLILLLPFLRDAPRTIAWRNHHALTRADVERLALNLVSRSHEVAQLRFELGSKPTGKSRTGLQITSFGLLARR